MELLKRMHVRRRARIRGDRFDQRLRAGHRGYARHVVLQRGAPDRLFIKTRDTAQRRVDDQRYLAASDLVSDVWSAFVYFENILDIQPNFSQARRRAERCLLSRRRQTGPWIEGLADFLADLSDPSIVTAHFRGVA